MYKFLIKPILFLSDPEKVHYLVFSWIKTTLKTRFVRNVVRKAHQVHAPILERNLFGLRFKNPIGLAAGFDKDAKLYEELGCLGFGFIEIGTVTPKPQEGNPKPRLFRLPKDKALVNRMGFNNEGVEAIVNRLKGRNKNLLIGGNIGKNKVTPNEEALNDYLICFNALFDHVDYFVVNVSSPNTPNLRALQEKKPLMDLLSALQSENNSKAERKPILLKIAPDLTDQQLDDIIEIIQFTKLDGVIATNTTIDRSNLTTPQHKVESIGNGGLSGAPLKKRSTEVIQYLKEKSATAFPVIAVGGIFTAEDAIEKLEAGADLLQVYTGFVYEGPSMVKKINRGIISYYESKKN